MENTCTTKEIELAKRGVDAFVDRANELHHQGRYNDAFKQLERARKLCEKRLGPTHLSTIKVLFILSSMHEADGSMRKPADCNLHFTFFDTSGTDSDTYWNYFSIASILRRRILVGEIGIPLELEFDNNVDYRSRHALAFFGDAPVAYGRWRVHDSHLIIDRLCVCPGYRNRGIGKLLLRDLLNDSTVHISQMQININAFEFHLPRQLSWLQRVFEKANFHPIPDTNGAQFSFYLRYCISPEHCKHLLFS
uniref:N-acetyltransferase domain-containing protein n=1 Tax=Aureoumbra lagunensis TaxID=44058 RepID=A0A7S3K657_9STRA|mmetsp:Transcript_18210/g.27466  ORF Transcript_18210/g.27466 Transcript_18210/m.27466 type:complete len:250 (+) Transcript_18210:42-791(+)